jgi:predicted RNase H-like HicB family nuclease
MRNGDGDAVKLRFTVDIVVEPDEDQFHAYAPALKGLHVGGRTEKEAIKNAIDATELYLQSLIRHGDPIPLGIRQEEIRADSGHEGVHAHTESLALTLA